MKIVRSNRRHIKGKLDVKIMDSDTNLRLTERESYKAVQKSPFLIKVFINVCDHVENLSNIHNTNLPYINVHCFETTSFSELLFIIDETHPIDRGRFVSIFSVIKNGDTRFLYKFEDISEQCRINFGSLSSREFRPGNQLLIYFSQFNNQSGMIRENSKEQEDSMPEQKFNMDLLSIHPSVEVEMTDSLLQ